MITKVVANHIERNYFNDYDEVRVDYMSEVSAEKIAKAITKLVNRFKSRGVKDTMFFYCDDGTAFRLGYQTVGMEEYQHPVLGTMYRGGHDALVLRHYTHIATDSWDTEKEVTLAQAKRVVLS